MKNTYQEKLTNYYKTLNIHPEYFNCPNSNYCRQFSNQNVMTETKMSMVGSEYGRKYPKIVVISLDPPSGKRKDGTNKRWEFFLPKQRITEYVSSIHESDNYSVDHANQHWAMTQIIVKDVLTFWGYKPQPYSAVVEESYSQRQIENVSSYFAHVNVAKCSMNYDGQRQAPEQIHTICSDRHLIGELLVLEPEILITQGATTNKLLGKKLIGKEILVSDLPTSKVINLFEKPLLWLPMRHPTQQLKQIRENWIYYKNILLAWQKSLK